MKRIFVILACLTVAGCAPAPVSETVADAAKESISVAYNSLPKECKTADVKKAHDNAQKQIDNITASCNLEKKNLEVRLAHKNLLILGLSISLGILILLTLRRILSGISWPTLGNLLGRHNQNNENQ